MLLTQNDISSYLIQDKHCGLYMTAAVHGGCFYKVQLKISLCSAKNQIQAL